MVSTQKRSVSKDPKESQSPDVWLGLAHLLILLFGIIGSIISVAIVKTQQERIHAYHSLNWQLSLLIYQMAIGILGVLGFIGMFLVLGVVGSLELDPSHSAWGIIGVLLFPLLFFTVVVSLISLSIINIVNCIRAMIKANVGESWRYPFSIRFITITDELV